MGWLKSTAISRLVAMPPLWGTTIDTVGPLEDDGVTGGVAIPLQLSKNITVRKTVETLESWRIDIQFLSQYLG